jgi:hypothetical protein
VVSILQGRSEEAAQAMSIAIRKCTSCLNNNKTTHGFVIEIELFGMLAELCFTRARETGTVRPISARHLQDRQPA